MKKQIKKIKIFLPIIFVVTILLLFVNNIPVKAEKNEEIILPKSYNIRDDYVLFSEYQDMYGLCWSFATNKTIETTILKNTNQLFNFSEAYNGLLYNKDKIYGSEGNEDKIFNALNRENKGLVLEQDLEYLFSFYFLTNQNTNLYEKEFRKYKLNEFNNVFKRKYFNLDPKKQNNEEERIRKRNEAKNHIYKQGGIYIIVDNYTLAKNNKDKDYYKYDYNVKNVGHAITIIGWDDNFQESLHSVQKGAWIAINSNYHHNNASTIFIPYSSYSIEHYAVGYEIDKNSSLFKLKAKRDNRVKNNLTGYSNSENNFSSTTTFAKNENVFLQDENINLTYSYEDNNAKKLLIDKILYNKKDITNEFNVSYLSNKSINIKSNSNLHEGSYKIIFKVENNINENELIREFFIFSTLDSLYIKNIHLGYKNYNEEESSNFYFPISINQLNVDEKELNVVVDNNYKNKRYPDLNIKLNAYSPEIIDNYDFEIIYKNKSIKKSSEYKYDEIKLDEYNFNKISLSLYQKIDDKRPSINLKIKKSNTKEELDTFSLIIKNKYTNYKKRYNFNVYFLNQKDFILPYIYFIDSKNILGNNLNGVKVLTKNSNFKRYYLNIPENIKGKISKIKYLQKDGTYNYLPFDASKNKFYIEYDILQKNKFSGYNYIEKDAAHYTKVIRDNNNYSLILQPEYKEDIKLDIKIDYKNEKILLKTNSKDEIFYSIENSNYEKINSNEIDIKESFFGKTVLFKIDDTVFKKIIPKKEKLNLRIIQKKYNEILVNLKDVSYSFDKKTFVDSDKIKNIDLRKKSYSIYFKIKSTYNSFESEIKKLDIKKLEIIKTDIKFIDTDLTKIKEATIYFDNNTSLKYKVTNIKQLDKNYKELYGNNIDKNTDKVIFTLEFNDHKVEKEFMLSRKILKVEDSDDNKVENKQDIIPNIKVPENSKKQKELKNIINQEKLRNILVITSVSILVSISIIAFIITIKRKKQ